MENGKIKVAILGVGNCASSFVQGIYHYSNNNSEDGLISDYDFFEWIEKNISALLNRDEDSLRYAILTSCKNKAKIVSKDEHEQGLRAILNLGHTFAHAIETITEYKFWLHGEAVGFGMILALDLSRT